LKDNITFLCFVIVHLFLMGSSSRTTIREAQKLAQRIFQEINEAKRQRWSPFAVVASVLEEAGEVAGVVKGLEGYKPPDKPRTKGMLAGEISDLFYNLFVLASLYDLDLEGAYVETVNRYKTRLLSQC
jgi:NTP pyrophosphatase (non-canonical NTP hydrolase)